MRFIFSTVYNTILKLYASLTKDSSGPIRILPALLSTVDLTTLSLTWSTQYWMIQLLGDTYLERTQKEVPSSNLRHCTELCMQVLPKGTKKLRQTI